MQRLSPNRSTREQRSLLALALLLALPVALAAAATLTVLQWSAELAQPRVVMSRVSLDTPAFAGASTITPSPGADEPQTLPPMVEAPPAS